MGAFTAAFFAAAAVTAAYLPLWLTDRGVAPSQVGALLGATSLVRLLAMPLWGAAADRVRHSRPMLLLGAALATAGTVALPLSRGLLPLLLLLTLQGIAGAALTPLTDSLTLALANSGRLLYGRVRAWGSASYMLATAAAGPVLAWAGTAAMPWLVAGAYAAATLLSRALPDSPVNGPLPALARRTMGLLRITAFRLTIAASALIQGSHAAYYAFAAIHWRAAGLGDTTIGLLIAEGITMEIALFIWGGRFVARMGPARLTAVAAGACLVRWTVLAFTTEVAALATVQILHAATFAMQHLSAMAVLSRVIPPGRAAGAQTLHAALGFSAPTGLLIWLCGLGYARWGGGIFLPMALLGGCGLLVTPALARALAAKPVRPTVPSSGTVQLGHSEPLIGCDGRSSRKE